MTESQTTTICLWVFSTFSGFYLPKVELYNIKKVRLPDYVR